MTKFIKPYNTKIIRIILTFFIVAFSILNINASCAWNGLYAFPSGKTLRQNPIIIIDGYAASQDVVKGFTKKYPVYLVNGKLKIKLIVKEILIGQFRLTQAVLIPETNLTVGLEYTLVIDKLPKDEFIDRWNSELKKNEPIVYKVVDDVDIIKPTFNTRPKEIKKSHIYYGCGPSIHVIFSCNVIASLEYLVKATLKNLKSGKTTSYFISPSNGNLEVGHDMCSGAFKLEDGENYEIEFSIMDASGNYTSWIGDPIKFTNPTVNDTK